MEENPIRTVGEVSLEQRTTTAMHSAIQALVRIMSEGEGTTQLQAATYLLDLGTRQGIPITEYRNLDEYVDRSLRAEPRHRFPVDRSHVVNLGTLRKAEDYD